MATHPDDPEAGFPKPGDVLKRLRQQKGLSLREVGDQAELSPSFLGALERGETDIALENLARLARIFGHDVGSFLGYSPRRAQPQFLGEDERVRVDRGPGVDYRVLRVPGVGFELVLVNFKPKTAFRDALAHEGVDIVLVTQGRVTAIYNDESYVMGQGDCVLWSGGYSHSFRNDSDEPAQLVAVVTATVY
jgi:transcriptional regulator with XRE-family HTH domain